VIYTFTKYDCGDQIRGYRRWAVNLARIKKKRNNTGVCRKPEKRDYLEYITINGIKVDLKEIGWEGTDWPRTGTGDRQFLTW
jgi:hypothetical protein